VPSAICWDREFADSPLEQAGFELAVPPPMANSPDLPQRQEALSMAIRQAGGPVRAGYVVVLYYSVFAAGVRATQSVDAMAVTYMVTTLIWLPVALRFVNPTQLASVWLSGPAVRKVSSNIAMVRTSTSSAAARMPG
jgi:hypothetical protein